MPQNSMAIAATIAPLLSYLRAECSFAEQSLVKYRDCSNQLVKFFHEEPLQSVSPQRVTELKSWMIERGLGVSRRVSIIAALKRLLAFERDRGIGLSIDPAQITFPKRERREVDFLSSAEVERFVQVIPVWKHSGEIHADGLRFRALVECLLGSAARIGELLSLDRQSMDFENREARVIGKGNKQRVLFFTDRAITWLKLYLSTRRDGDPSLFASRHGQSRLSRADLWRPFNRYRLRAGLSKPVRPHLLRHTAATQLLFNGCPVGHIKEILGHERLETTCRYSSASTAAQQSRRTRSI